MYIFLFKTIWTRFLCRAQRTLEGYSVTITTNNLKIQFIKHSNLLFQCSFFQKISNMDVLQGVSLSLFWVGMTLGPERTMQTIFCGIFFFAENCLSNISPSFKRLQLQFTKSLIRFSFACSCVWCVLEDKRQRSHIFRRVDESFLCPQQTKNTGVFVSLCYISESTVTPRC